MRLDVMGKRADGSWNWRTVDQYLQTYFSGLDARVYANDTWLDDLVFLQWDLQEATQPLFAYHDYVFRTCLHGSRRVQGTFGINFKRGGYIYQLLKELQDGVGQAPAGRRGSDQVLETEAFRLARSGKADAQTFLDLALQGGALTKDRNGRAKVDPAALDNLLHDFEHAIWGDPGAVSARANPSYDPQQLSLNGPRFATVDGPIRFNLHIQYGEAEAAESDRRRLLKDAKGLHDLTQKARFPVYTREKLVGVELTGRGTVLNDDGKPIIETYAFIAQDLF